MPRVNIFKECRDLHLRLWECPSFLFVAMGLITILAMLSTYLITQQYENPKIVIISVVLVTVIILIIGYSVVKSVEKIAQASRMKSEFVSIASHQLRSPLSSLKWTLGQLAKSDLSEKQKDYLAMIKESNQQMIKLVKDLLDVSRIEQGRFDLRPELINLSKITQEVVEELSPFAQASNVGIKLKKEKNLPLTFADPEKIKMVIQNLVNNAIQYIKGQGKIDIVLKRKNNKLLFLVKDSGVGIPAYQQKQVFQKFFRSDNILKHQTQGTGLGLFIAHAIIKANNGAIGFRSKQNKGSIFWFTLPVSPQ